MLILILTPNFPLSTDLSNYNPFGGAIVYGEAIALRKSGANILVLTPHVPGSLSYEEDKYGIKIYRFRYFFPTQFQRIRLPNQPIYSKEKLFLRLFQIPFFLVSVFLSLFKLIQTVDIIYANWAQTALLALPFKWLFKKPELLNIYEHESTKNSTNDFIFIAELFKCFNHDKKNKDFYLRFKAHIKIINGKYFIDKISKIE